ncbi:MAG TPA: DEAD/DEAH box helicase [Gemmatimonadales bacterium]|nr:DEAD/DEAH box helicase [Gemmatimonadales bacterium]
MSGFDELQLAAPVGAALEALGWTAADAAVRDAVPTALRGHPVAALVPPAGRWAAPALAAGLSRLAPEGGLQALLLAPSTLIADLGEVTGRLAAPLGLRVLVAGALGRATARIQSGAAQVLVATPDTALALLHRSLLPTEALRLVALAWPELAGADAALEAVLPDLPRDAQRLAFTSRPERLADLAERWARKALTVGVASGVAASVGPVRAAIVPRGRRLAALDAVLDVLDPASLAVWVADRSEAGRVREHLAGRDLPVTVGQELQSAACVVAYDLPDRDALVALAALAKEVVVLVPAIAEGWLASVAQPIRPLRLPDAADAAADAAAQARAAVAARLEAGAGGAGLLAVSPLLERWDAAAVAGALYELWRAAVPAAPAPAAGAAPVAETARIWAGAGKRDGATPADFVAALTKEIGLDRTQIGRIDLRESFALIEVPAAEADRIARALDGVSIRRRRIAARVDRSAARPAGAGGPRRGPGRPSRPGA